MLITRAFEKPKNPPKNLLSLTKRQEKGYPSKTENFRQLPICSSPRAQIKTAASVPHPLQQPSSRQPRLLLLLGHNAAF